VCPPHEIAGVRQEIILDRFHPLWCQRAGILDGLLADFSEPRVDVWVIDVRGLALQHAARLEVILEYRKVLRIVDLLGLLFRIQMIKIAVEFIEAVHCRQVFVAVAEVIFADLGCHVALRLEEFCQSRVFGLKALRGTGQSDRGQARAHWKLTGDEGGSTRRAVCLGVAVRQKNAVTRDTIDIRRRRAHHAAVVRTYVEPADIIGEDEQDIGLLGFGHLSGILQVACGSPRLWSAGRKLIASR